MGITLANSQSTSPAPPIILSRPRPKTLRLGLKKTGHLAEDRLRIVRVVATLATGTLGIVVADGAMIVEDIATQGIIETFPGQQEGTIVEDSRITWA